VNKIAVLKALFVEVNKLQAGVVGVDPIDDERLDFLIHAVTAVRDELNHIDQEADDA
jgi:hypothetical protein